MEKPRRLAQERIDKKNGLCLIWQIYMSRRKKFDTNRITAEEMTDTAGARLLQYIAKKAKPKIKTGTGRAYENRTCCADRWRAGIKQ